jgi:molybdate transport system substrate-binding protein
LRPCIAAVLLLLGLLRAQAGEVSVAVAANFAMPMQKIAAAFEQSTGHHAVLAFGSTGRFYAQVKAGAPFQVLLAADAGTPAKLESEGFAVRGSRFTYATGRLVLWSLTPGLVDGRGDVLRQPGTGKIAIADPRLAPYGAAAMQAIGKLGLTTALQPRLVVADNIAQAYQFANTGNAQLGFLALSQVMLDGRIGTGSAWLVPQSLHAPIRQDAVLLNPGKGNPAAAALLDFLRGDAARAIILAHGYQL